MEEMLLFVILLMANKRRSTRRIELKLLRDNSDPFSLEDNTFIKFFRLPKIICRDLVLELQPQEVHKSRIPFVFKFLSVLNFYGHGSYQKSVAHNYTMPMSQPSVSRNIAAISNLIIQNKIDLITFPHTEEEKALKKFGFYSKFGIKGTIGAIDCTHVSIASPPVLHTQRPAHLYMNRKGYYSINVEAVCDHDLRFLHLNARFPGSCHDSGIWTTSSVRMHLVETHSMQRFNWLIGDSGYPLEPWLLTPFANPISSKERLFNEMHIKARNSIERAFGVLKSRFRCLCKERTLHYDHTKAGKIIYACAILHNILVQRGITEVGLDILDEIDSDELETIEAHIEYMVNDYFNEGRRIRNSYINTL